MRSLCLPSGLVDAMSGRIGAGSGMASTGSGIHPYRQKMLLCPSGPLKQPPSPPQPQQPPVPPQQQQLPPPLPPPSPPQQQLRPSQPHNNSGMGHNNTSPSLYRQVGSNVFVPGPAVVEVPRRHCTNNRHSNDNYRHNNCRHNNRCGCAWTGLPATGASRRSRWQSGALMASTVNNPPNDY